MYIIFLEPLLCKSHLSVEKNQHTSDLLRITSGHKGICTLNKKPQNTTVFPEEINNSLLGYIS